MLQVAGDHEVLEGSVVGVLDGLHAGVESGLDVVGSVVDEEDAVDWGLERLGGVVVDSRFWLGEMEGVGPGAVVKAREPGMAGEDTRGHRIADVGEDAGADAGVLEGLCPVDHGEVELAPEIGVGMDEGIDLVRSEEKAGVASDLIPVGEGGEIAAVVGVTMGPVGGVKLLLVEVGDGTHAGPCGGVGWAGQNHAVVKEDSLDG